MNEMNNQLSRSDLMSLEDYSSKRDEFRQMVIAHKKNRQVALGDHARLYFEDRVTMQYQVQEILRIEKIFEGDAIEEELDAYNPLIPDGTNWKATFMIEYDDPDERRVALGRLIGIEQRVWVKVGELEKIYPIANEDLVRETEDKTSAVHFLRFELPVDVIEAAKNGEDISMGVEHPEYEYDTGALPTHITKSLVGDLQRQH